MLRQPICHFRQLINHGTILIAFETCVTRTEFAQQTLPSRKIVVSNQFSGENEKAMNLISTKVLVRLGHLIHKNRDDFVNILTRISTWKATKNEIDLSIEALVGAGDELSDIPHNLINNLTVYLPVNVILFSYVLYVVMPSVFAKRIYFRPSVRVRDESYAIHQRMKQLVDLPVEISYASRSIFWKQYGSNADMIVFTGKCANAIEFENRVAPSQMFIYFGSGVNPMVVGKNADVKTSVQDAAEIRLHNSGQDCLCPDLVLVNKDVLEPFLRLLIERLKEVRFGPLQDPSTDYSNLSYPDVAEFCLEYFEERKKDIVFGGNVNVLDRYVQPTVLVQDISELNSIPEFFAPVFNIASYGSIDQVVDLLSHDAYKHKSMGAMLYGADDLVPAFSQKHMVTVNTTLFEVNHGNKPFGGWDICASHIKYGGKITAKPLLISDVVRELLTGGYSEEL